MSPAGRSGQPRRVSLLGRVGCHLCEEAEAELRKLLGGYPAVSLEVIDIESDEDLHRRHLERIPVVEVDGREVCVIFFEPDEIRAALDG